MTVTNARSKARIRGQVMGALVLGTGGVNRCIRVSSGSGAGRTIHVSQIFLQRVRSIVYQ